MDREFLTGSAIVGTFIAYVVSFVLWWRAIQRRRRQKAQQEEAFITALLLAIENKAVESLAHVVDFHRGHFNTSPFSSADRQQLSALLRRAAVRVATRQTAASVALAETIEVLRRVLAANEETLKAEELRVPFSGTPSPERELLEDLLELTRGEKEQVRNKLNEIARAIAIRQDTVHRLGEEGRQSLRYAKLGLFGTLFFSLVSIALTIWAFWK